MVEAVVVASSDVAITSAEDDELFAKNFFKQKRILIISMIVPLPPPKKCLLSMTLLGILLLNRKAKHLSNCIAFHYYFRGSGCDFSAENIDDDK